VINEVLIGVRGLRGAIERGADRCSGQSSRFIVRIPYA
jgi:hypothetical protein